MIAYNTTTLDNLIVQKETAKAYKQNFLSKEEKTNIALRYPVDFYSPNFFIRVGLFILTGIIASFSMGFFSLFLIESNKGIVGVFCIIFGGCAYAALEYMVKTKKHYQSGVDDALIYLSASAVFGGILLLLFFTDDIQWIPFFILLLIIAAYMSIRFANVVTSVIAYLSILGILFFACTDIGGIAKAVVPFVILAASAICYWVIKINRAKPSLRYYKACLQTIIVATLLTFYIAGNYFIVRELSNTMFTLNLLPQQSIPFGGVFWVFTIVIPFGYLFYGIKNKDVFLLRVSLLLFAATIFTIRKYHVIMSLEIAMTIAGIALIGGSYALIRFLQKPKYGFTYKELYSDNPIDKLQIESLLIAQGFSHQADTSDSTNFGGGSSGGGGASGEF